MSGGILQLPTYAFLTWTGTNLHLRWQNWSPNVVDLYRMTVFMCVNEYLTGPCGFVFCALWMWIKICH